MGKLTAYALTDVGKKRDHNEDAFAVVDDLQLYVVCDGMGGHASGEVASRLAVEHAVAFVREQLGSPRRPLPYRVAPNLSPDEALLSNAIQHANDRVYIEGMKDPRLEGMGTTVVAILARADKLVVAHVGDSRIYRWTPGGRLDQVTRDHSLLNHKIDAGELTTDEEIAAFRQGNIIVRAVGLKDYVEPEVQTVPRRPGELYLLCSDGLTDMVDDWSITNVLEVNTDALPEAATSLVRMANDRGGKDNITVLLLRVDDPAEREEATDPNAALLFHDEDTQPAGIQAVAEPLPATLPLHRAAPAPSTGPLAEPDEEVELGFDDLHDEPTDPGLSDQARAALLAEVRRAPAPRAPIQVQSGTTTRQTGPQPRTAPPPLPPAAPPSVIVEDGGSPSIIVDDSLYET